MTEDLPRQIDSAFSLKSTFICINCLRVNRTRRYRSSARATLAAVVATVALVFGALSAPPAGPGTYWELEALLVDFFPTADRVSYEQIQLTSDEIGAIESRLGYRPERTQWTVFMAWQSGELSGYAIIDEEAGQHEPITFAVRMRIDGEIDRVEVVTYREAWGEEIRSERFRRQFVGRNWQDRMEVDRDIVAVSGATISSRSIAVGARRATAVTSVLCDSRGPSLAGSTSTNARL